MNIFKSRKAKKAGLEDSVSRIDLSIALPSPNDFRTSLIMPNLSARFSMLREQDDPSSLLGKAHDDSVLAPPRKSQLADYGYVASSTLSHISEVSSVNGSVKAPSRPSPPPHPKQPDFLNTPPASEASSYQGSVLNRPRAVGTSTGVLFGGRQTVYRVNSGRPGVPGRTTTDDDPVFLDYSTQENHPEEEQRDDTEQICPSGPSSSGRPSEPPSVPNPLDTPNPTFTKPESLTEKHSMAPLAALEDRLRSMSLSKPLRMQESNQSTNAPNPLLSARLNGRPIPSLVGQQPRPSPPAGLRADAESRSTRPLRVAPTLPSYMAPQLRSQVEVPVSTVSQHDRNLEPPASPAFPSPGVDSDVTPVSSLSAKARFLQPSMPAHKQASSTGPNSSDSMAIPSPALSSQDLRPKAVTADIPIESTPPPRTPRIIAPVHHHSEQGVPSVLSDDDNSIYDDDPQVNVSPKPEGSLSNHLCPPSPATATSHHLSPNSSQSLALGALVQHHLRPVSEISVVSSTSNEHPDARSDFPSLPTTYSDVNESRPGMNGAATVPRSNNWDMESVSADADGRQSVWTQNSERPESSVTTPDDKAEEFGLEPINTNSAPASDWRDMVNSHHTRDDSTSTQTDKARFMDELQKRKQVIQTKLRDQNNGGLSYSPAISRGVSPAPTSATHSFLRPKVSMEKLRNSSRTRAKQIFRLGGKSRNVSPARPKIVRADESVQFDNFSRPSVSSSSTGGRGNDVRNSTSGGSELSGNEPASPSSGSVRPESQLDSNQSPPSSFQPPYARSVATSSVYTDVGSSSGTGTLDDHSLASPMSNAFYTGSPSPLSPPPTFAMAQHPNRSATFDHLDGRKHESIPPVPPLPSMPMSLTVGVPMPGNRGHLALPKRAPNSAMSSSHTSPMPSPLSPISPSGMFSKGLPNNATNPSNHSPPSSAHPRQRPINRNDISGPMRLISTSSKMNIRELPSAGPAHAHPGTRSVSAGIGGQHQLVALHVADGRSMSGNGGDGRDRLGPTSSSFPHSASAANLRRGLPPLAGGGSGRNSATSTAASTPTSLGFKNHAPHGGYNNGHSNGAGIGVAGLGLSAGSASAHQSGRNSPLPPQALQPGAAGRSTPSPFDDGTSEFGYINRSRSGSASGSNSGSGSGVGSLSSRTGGLLRKIGLGR